MIGLPGVSIPAGYDAASLPIGLQAMADHWNEHVLLRVAHALENTAQLHAPATYFSPL